MSGARPARPGRRAACAMLSLVLPAWLPSAWAGAYEDFFTALRRDHVAAVQQLLARGFDPNALDPKGVPALVAALREKSYAVARVLMAHPRIDIDRVGSVDETALMVACHQGEMELARSLVQRGAQLNRPGWTPLHYAATAGQLEAVRFLLDEAAYIDAESPNRTTPLMMAARHKQITIVRYLIEQGADPTVRNQAGLSAADYLERQGEREAAGFVQASADAFRSRYRAGSDAARPPPLPGTAGGAGTTGSLATPVRPARLPGERPAADR